MSPFLFVGPLSCKSRNAVLRWPKYTPHPVQLQWTYQVSGLAIHISISLVTNVNAAARIDVPVTETVTANTQ